MMAHGKNETDHYFSAKPKSKPRFGLIQTYLRGRSFKFLTASGVFSKKRVDLGTKLLIEAMVLPETGLVLDMGCGYGAVGIAAATFNPKLHVIMVDVNERAVKLARRNVELNNVYNVEVKRGNLYEPVKGMLFHCILSNPPVSTGLSTVKAIITEAPKHMAEKATLQMVFKSKIGGKRLQQIFHETFGNCTILARESGYRVLMAEKG
ncbi:MAG: class I SAM-dependent methyltransferase [Candidatus Bathyarchaeota archaeon]|nr:class I SAM-dependent methyltransferase [Candidatus Bathyarchaeota archaeon]